MVETIGELNKPLTGKRALIAGGDGEIGSVISAGLAADGADVAIAGLEKESCQALADRLATGENRTAGYAFDTTDADSVAGLVDDLTQEWGGIDILVNCVGILKINLAENFDAAEWRSVVDINLTGAFLLSQAVGRAMIKGGEGGRIVHMTSVRGLIGLQLGGFAAYGASKAGLHLLIKQLASEWGKHQISINGVGAGFVRTALSEAALQNPDFANMVADRTPLGRVAEIQEVANTAIYLAGPRSSFITGQILYVDGGLSASQ
jgi:NAD(P)-dependent dehydrogenase (short-subunit alcohol dehydrogenase family)